MENFNLALILSGVIWLGLLGGIGISIQAYFLLGVGLIPFYIIVFGSVFGKECKIKGDEEAEGK